jgi:hypothetical protein
MLTRTPLVALLALLAPTVACVGLDRPPGTFFDTAPPGAHVIVDGRDSGFTTPCLIDMTDTEGPLVTLARDGYQPATIRLVDDRTITVVHWRDAAVEGTLWNFPIFLPAFDLFVPIRIDPGPRPKRIHVKLRLAGDAG